MQHPRCSLCDGGGPLVQVTCSRYDTKELLDSTVVCPECFARCEDFMDIFGVGVIHRDEEGVAHLAGREPEDE